MTAFAKRITKGRDPRLWTADQFLDFYMTRPDGERWQLVDGLAMMVAPPMLVHQRIVGNVLRLLHQVEEGPFGEAYSRILVRIPGVADFSAAPDLIWMEAEGSQEYFTEHFTLAAEVVSSREIEMIERKLDLYRSHPDNLYCLTIDQDSVHVTLFAREESWARTDLFSLDDVLRLPAFGFAAKLADIYKGTPLAL